MLVSRFLFAVGAALVLGGVAGITLAIVDPELVLAQLPPLAIDAAAVGGAVAALGASALAVGAAHLLVVAPASLAAQPGHEPPESSCAPRSGLPCWPAPSRHSSAPDTVRGSSLGRSR